MKVFRAILVGLIATMGATVHANHATLTASQQPASVTMSGCLRQGSATDVFILRGAVPAGQEQPPRDQLIVNAGGGVTLSAHLNQRVSITGSWWRSGGPTPPSGANAVERALSRLEARSLAVVADKCSGMP